jgi:hypothetical protein
MTQQHGLEELLKVMDGAPGWRANQNTKLMKFFPIICVFGPGSHEKMGIGWIIVDGTFPLFY